MLHCAKSGTHRRDMRSASYRSASQCRDAEAAQGGVSAGGNGAERAPLIATNVA